jgi:DNA invertase Pin-like site-specific DNA recombinase
MVAARNRAIDCVLVWKFDRFARSTRHLLAALEEFDHLGVRFVSVQDQIDTDSPMGRAMFTIIGAMAELEASLISERVTAGMRAAEARRRHLGRPEPNSTLSTRSRRWPPPRISAFGKFRRKSEVEPAAESSAKSQSVRAPCSLRPCDHFLHVS